MRHRTKTLLAIAAVILTVMALWLTNRAVTPKTATMEDVVAEARAGGYELLSTEELASMREKRADLLLVDTRQDWEYRAGHIVDAVLFPMEPTAWARWSQRHGRDGARKTSSLSCWGRTRTGLLFSTERA